MSRPKIAFIMPDKIIKPVGGMGVQAKYIINHLEKDFDFQIYGFPEESDSSNYHSVFNPLTKIAHHGVRTLFGQITYLAEIIKNGKPDIIHVSDFTLYLAGVMASRAYNIPLVISMQLSAHLMEQQNLLFSINHESIDGQAIQNAFKEMELLGLREADKIIHVSKTYKDFFAKVTDTDSKSVYIPNGVDLAEWKNFKKIKLPGTQPIKLVYLGRLSMQKNILSLLHAYIPANIDLIFVGEKNTADSHIFELMSEKCKTEKNIHYFGPAYDQDKIDILSSADAVIIPSVHECHPIIMHEALASKNVILSSFVNDMSVVLDESFALNCGLNQNSITQALYTLSKLSQKEIKEKQDQGFEVVQKYDWSIAAQKTKEVYLEVLQIKK